MNEHYKLSDEKEGKVSEAELEEKVIEKIEKYISNPDNAEIEFALSDISPTLHSIDMTYAGEPRTLRARLGKKFFKMMEKGEGNYANVVQVMTKKGTPKRSYINRAAVYKVVKR